MKAFGKFYLDKEKDIVVELYMEEGKMTYVLRTPNHGTGNLISNLAKLIKEPIYQDERDYKIMKGEIPSYYDGSNRLMYIMRLGNT